MKILIDVFNQIRNSKKTYVDYTIPQVLASSTNVNTITMSRDTSGVDSLFFINKPGSVIPVITIHIDTKNNNTITFVVNATTYNINDDPDIFAFIALKLLYHISLWNEEILQNLKIDTKYATNYAGIIECIQEFFTGKNLDILQLSAALPTSADVKTTILPVLMNGVTADSVDNFIASITEAFKTPTPAAESNTSTSATASATKASTPITLDILTKIVTAAYDNAIKQIKSIGSKLTQEKFVKSSSTDPAKKINDLQKANNALRDITTEISNAIDSYKPENEDPTLKPYNDAIAAITNAIDKVKEAASSSPPSDAVDAAVKALYDVVKKTNYNNDTGYEQTLDADISKVEQAKGNEKVGSLENLLFLVISTLDPKYEKAVELVDKATNAAGDANTNANQATAAQAAATLAQAAAEKAGVAGSAAAPAAAAAAAAAVANAAVDRATGKTKDAVNAATIYNNFFKTIKNMTTEYDAVNNACKVVTTSLTPTDSSSPINFKDVTTNLKDLKVALEALKLKFDHEYGPQTFSLFNGGGSKTKTKSKSSSSHKSKSKSKNKTKKNHSHSGKRKIPKIKMN
jgi:soluble cytochrome b562